MIIYERLQSSHSLRRIQHIDVLSGFKKNQFDQNEALNSAFTLFKSKEMRKNYNSADLN